MTRAVIDPVTRIEGHLRVECEVESGVVKDAWVSGTLYRGMETVLKGRAPEDAFYVAQRICGVCPVSHGHASTKSTEAALNVKVPNGARIVRNIIEAAEFLHSHILWFYTLTALDYVDVSSALNADVSKTLELAKAAGTRVADFGAVQTKLKKFIAGGQLSIFTNAPFGHPAYKLTPELNLIATAHYLEALEMQAEAADVIAIMGGKFPHFMTSIPGGTAWMPTEEKLGQILFRLQKVKAFIDEALIPDTLAIAPMYTDALSYGKGVGNFLAWGVFEAESNNMKDRYMPAGVIMGGQLTLADADPTKVIEYVDHSWYKAADGNLNPAQGKTDAEFTSYNVADKYSWGKAPRYDGKPMEVGPLSRMLVAYLAGRQEVKTLVDSVLAKLGVPGKPEVLISLLGRVAARNLEAAIVADWSLQWVNELVAAVKGGEASFFTKPTGEAGQGAGLWEAPRGALGHWIDIKGGKIANYQVIAPSTWDISPRDKDGVRGPMEEALIGCPVADVTKPLEPLRIVHSFDP
jgi:[NiFe] hydrogenase large subunit